MNRIILLGVTAAALAFAATQTFAAGAGNLRPDASPYALLAPQSLQFGTMSEGRSAYVDGQPGYAYGSGGQAGYAAPAPIVTPEERSYYSRGR